MLTPLGGDLPRQFYVDTITSLSLAWSAWSVPFVGLFFRARHTENRSELALYQGLSIAVLLLSALPFVPLFFLFPVAGLALTPFFAGPALLLWCARRRLKHLRERLWQLTS